ncbi:MAG: 30S ribosomal protein S17 [Phycisphaerales bacterium]|nr:30S ribosomal protein S17 [Phycisphaerales bacterium]
MTNENTTAAATEALTSVRLGVVDSDARDKTRRVVIAYRAKHPKYGKYVSKRTRLHVHDERNESRMGDTVEIVQCRPMSKTKSWKLLRVVKRGTEA